MMTLLEYGFWFVCFMIGYVYVGYPFTLYLLSGVIERKVKKGDVQLSITIIISAYNEEACIGETIKNKLELSYPKDKMEIIVVSDGSTDRTDQIVREWDGQGVRLLRQEPRKGKTSALNMAVKEARGELLVFSDANSLYRADAISHLVKNFNDPEVGYATGNMVYVNADGTAMGDGCSAYMKFENALRMFESSIGSIVGVDGGIDAIRSLLYQSMRADQLPDFVLPLKVVEQGFRVVYEPLAVLHEHTLKSSKDEYKMRVRVCLRALWALWDMKKLFNVFKYGVFSVQLLFHKALRYMAFVLLFSLYFSNMFLLSRGTIYQVAFVAQSVFYLGSYLGFMKERAGKGSRLFNLPYYFVLGNLAAGHAFLKFMRGTKQVIWTPRIG